MNKTAGKLSSLFKSTFQNKYFKDGKEKLKIRKRLSGKSVVLRRALKEMTGVI